VYKSIIVNPLPSPSPYVGLREGGNFASTGGRQNNRRLSRFVFFFFFNLRNQKSREIGLWFRVKERENRLLVPKHKTTIKEPSFFKKAKILTLKGSIKKEKKRNMFRGFEKRTDHYCI